jgi:hypothetical protein
VGFSLRRPGLKERTTGRKSRLQGAQLLQHNRSWIEQNGTKTTAGKRTLDLSDAAVGALLARQLRRTAALEAANNAAALIPHTLLAPEAVSSDAE